MKLILVFQCYACILLLQLEAVKQEKEKLQRKLNDSISENKTLRDENKRLQGMLNDTKAEKEELHDALSSIHQTTKVNYILAIKISEKFWGDPIFTISFVNNRLGGNFPIHSPCSSVVI